MFQQLNGDYELVVDYYDGFLENSRVKQPPSRSQRVMSNDDISTFWRAALPPVWRHRPWGLTGTFWAEITVASEGKPRWVLTTSSDQTFNSVNIGDGISPIGPWQDGITCEPVPVSMPIVSMLAFPVPQLDYAFYADVNHGLFRRRRTRSRSRSSGGSDSGGSGGGADAAAGAAGGGGVQDMEGLLFLETVAGERIPAVYIKTPKARLTIIYSHGNGEDIGLLLHDMDELARSTNTNVLIYEYVGYSISRLEGAIPTEAGCYRSIDAAWRFLTVDMKVAVHTIILYGRSIGSGPTCDMASKPEAANLAGVALQAPIASGARVVFGDAGVAARPLDIFTNYSKIGKVTRPVAIMHGTADQVVPITNGEALFDALQSPHEPLWLAGYGHNNMPLTLCNSYVAKFVRKLTEELEARKDLPPERAEGTEGCSVM